MKILDKYRALIPLLLIVLIDEMGNALFFPILPPILLDPVHGILHHGVSMAIRQFDYGLTLAIFPMMMFFSAPILGDLSDQFGRKRILLLSLLGTVLGYLISAYGVSHESVAFLILGRGLDGLTAGNFTVAQAAIIDLSTKENKTANISLMVFAISMGLIIGPLMAGVLSNEHLVSWFTLATPLYVAGVLALMNSVLLVLGFQETHQMKTLVNQIKPFQGIFLFLEAFKMPKLRKLSYLLFLLLLGWGSYIQFISVFLFVDYGFTKNQIAGFNVLMAASIAMGSTFVIRWLLKRFKNETIALIAFIGSLCGVLLTILIKSFWIPWIGLIFPSMAIVLGHSTIMALYSNAVDDSRQGWIMGVTGAVLSLAIMISALMDGFLGNISSYLPLWIAVFSYGAGIVVCFVRKT